MRIFLLLGVLSLHINLRAQQFLPSVEISLPDSIESAIPEAIDLDNDGLLDYALLVTTHGNKSFLMHVKGDTVQPMVLSTASTSIQHFNAYIFDDYDHDNQMDFILSNKEEEMSVLYHNDGDFVFTAAGISLPACDVIRFADLNNDGVKECILSTEGNGGLHSMKTFRQSGQTWEMLSDSLKAKITDLEVADFNRDGFTDIFISGLDESADSLFSAVLLYENTKYKLAAAERFAGNGSIADLNYDGQPDLVVGGKDADQHNVYSFFQADGDSFIVTDHSANVQIWSAFVADLSSDGKIDHAIAGILANDTISNIRYADGSLEDLSHTSLSKQIFADIEHDGDLDLIQIRKKTSCNLIVFENTTSSVNLAPRGPKHGISVPIYGHQFFYWEQATDDHTPISSITYDFYLEADDAEHSAEFDLLNSRRLSVTHGNNGTVNFRMVRNFNSTDIKFAIQSVDNALHADENSTCIGSGSTCHEFQQEVVTACVSEDVKLEAPKPVMWFSFNDGYLGKMSALDISASKEDTVFYLDPAFGGGCAVVKAFPVQVQEVVTKFTENFVACDGAELELAVPSSWTAVTWNGGDGESLGTGPGIDYTVERDNTIIASYKKSEECTYAKEFIILVSKPVLVTDPSSVKIVPGSSVGLSVAGAAAYEWSPGESLNDPHSPTPTAKPSATTKYIVTGADSIGCIGTAEVIVYVETSSAFIPSLFTPNGDGNNDELKVYGLDGADQFLLKIFNRDGSMVFSTTSVSEAAQKGWDGTKNGSRQPNGLYFWKVEGSIKSGELLLNGKKEGSILLIR
jgi:gliding motility-associated-like protein